MGSHVLGFVNHASRLVQIIQRRNIDQVNGQDIFAQECFKPGFHPFSFFMAWYMKRNRVSIRMLKQSSKQWRTVMIHIVVQFLSKRDSKIKIVMVIQPFLFWKSDKKSAKALQCS
ncbi:hypothetical protein D3C80_1884020 [compost metagenome]